jgi:hypothetical protein
MLSLANASGCEIRLRKIVQVPISKQRTAHGVCLLLSESTQMKNAIGLMACIAIAFLWITSPDSSKSHASKEPAASSTAGLIRLEQASSAANYDQLKRELDEKLDGLLDGLLESIQKDTADLSGKLRSTVESDLDRIDALEKKLDEIDKKLLAAAAPAASPIVSPVKAAATSTTIISTKPLAASVNASVSPSARSVVSSSIPSASVPAAPVNYSARWQNYDGLSPREHAEVMHGINTAGLTDAQIAMKRDRDHDIYGAGHPEAMRAANQAATSTRIPSSVTYSSNVSYRPPAAARPSTPTNVSYNTVPAAKSKPQVSSRPRLFSRWRSCPTGGCPN